MANKFYVHNDIFRYEDEVFGDSDAELDEGMSMKNTDYGQELFLQGFPFMSVVYMYYE